MRARRDPIVDPEEGWTLRMQRRPIAILRRYLGVVASSFT
jgi:hypothetical protein